MPPQSSLLGRRPRHRGRFRIRLCAQRWIGPHMRVLSNRTRFSSSKAQRCTPSAISVRPTPFVRLPARAYSCGGACSRSPKRSTAGSPSPPRFRSAASCQPNSSRPLACGRHMISRPRRFMRRRASTTAATARTGRAAPLAPPSSRSSSSASPTWSSWGGCHDGSARLPSPSWRSHPASTDFPAPTT